MELNNKIFKLMIRERFLLVYKDVDKEEIKLSTREREILHYLSHCMTAKTIARELSRRHNKTIVSSTVSSIICKQLYFKFHVCCISDLIKKAVLLEMLDFTLPEIPVVLKVEPEVEPENKQLVSKESE
jgi:hypothetical protein